MKSGSQRIKWRSLVRKREFQTVYGQGAKRVGRLVVVYLLVPERSQTPGEVPDFARAVVASKKVGNAVARNRAKRLMREAHRLGALGQLENGPGLADQLRHNCERLLREPGGRGVAGRQAPDQPAVEMAAAANESNTFAGLWVVLVARRRILSANSREVRDELDRMLGIEPQLQ